MKVLRIVLMVLGGIALLLVGFFVVVFVLTDDAADAANTLFARLAAGDAQGAYDIAAPQLREVQDLEAFTAAAATLGLDRFADASWNSREINGDRAAVEGAVTLDDGREVALRVELVEVGDDWRVVTFTSPSAGPSVGGGLAPIPDLEQARALTQAALGAFGDAIRRADFTEFYAGIAALWRAQTTAAELQAVFQGYIDAGATFTGIETLQPEFSAPPARDDDGALVLTGYVASGGDVLHFRLRFLYEHPAWRLIGINVGNAPISAPAE